MAYNSTAQTIAYVVRLNVRLWDETKVKIETDKCLGIGEAIKLASDTLRLVITNTNFADECIATVRELAKNEKFGEYRKCFSDTQLARVNVAIFKVNRF